MYFKRGLQVLEVPGTSTRNANAVLLCTPIYHTLELYLVLVLGVQ